MNLTIHLFLVPTAKINAAVPVFLPTCLDGMHRGNITFTFTLYETIMNVKWKDV